MIDVLLACIACVFSVLSLVINVCSILIQRRTARILREPRRHVCISCNEDMTWTATGMCARCRGGAA